MDGVVAMAGVSDKDVASKVVFLEKENQDLLNSMYLAKQLKNSHIDSMMCNKLKLSSSINRMSIND